MLQALIQRFKEAGAKTESDTDRDGAFSYHAETHAAGMGLAAGFFATATGQAKLLGLVYAAAVYGKAKESNGKRRRILLDIVQEPHYGVGGAIAGALIGLAVRPFVGEMPLPI